MTNPIYATWMLSNNIGDALTPWLIRKFTGKTPLYVPFTCQFPKYMLSGSILNHAVKYTTVWGAGIANEDDKIASGVDIRSVRGPLTARKVRLECGNNVQVVGDPAWLMPRYYDPFDEKKNYKVGIVPHYLHQAEVARWIGDRTDIKLINVFDNPEDFVDALCSCEVVYSSSLHGLILADAYGIPSQWIDCTDSIGGDGIKFVDHLILRDFLVSNGVYATVKLQRYIVAEAADLLDMTPSAPINRLHLQQLPKGIDELMGAIIDKAVPTAEARQAFCDVLWRVCPFNPDPAPVPEPEILPQEAPESVHKRTTRYTKPEAQENKDEQSETINPDPDDPGQGGETGPAGGGSSAAVAG